MSIEISQPEQQLSSEQKPIDTTSSPDIGNTNVVGSQSQLSTIENVQSDTRCYSGIAAKERIKSALMTHLQELLPFTTFELVMLIKDYWGCSPEMIDKGEALVSQPNLQ